MIFGRYHFICRFTDDANLPRFKGSTFRGVFGRALKNVVCALKRQECADCLLKNRCVYALVFETGETDRVEKGKRISSPPHPFVIEPPLEEDTTYKKDTPFEFNLLLFGDANNNLPYFIYAFSEMGRIGIGKKINGKRGPFVLHEVRTDEGVIYSREDGKLEAGNNLSDLSLDMNQGRGNGRSRLKLRMTTPMRLKFENRFSTALPFHVLVRAMLRRVSSLFEAYGEGEPDIDYRGLVSRAKDVAVIEDSLKWHDWKRYSLRQEQAMLMGGIMGSITYQGELCEFIPLIEICSIVHLGKQTTFGLGKFEIEKLK